MTNNKQFKIEDKLYGCTAQVTPEVFNLPALFPIILKTLL